MATGEDDGGAGFGMEGFKADGAVKIEALSLFFGEVGGIHSNIWMFVCLLVGI